MGGLGPENVVAFEDLGDDVGDDVGCFDSLIDSLMDAPGGAGFSAAAAPQVHADAVSLCNSCL